LRIVGTKLVHQFVAFVIYIHIK